MSYLVSSLESKMKELKDAVLESLKKIEEDHQKIEDLVSDHKIEMDAATESHLKSLQDKENIYKGKLAKNAENIMKNMKKINDNEKSIITNAASLREIDLRIEIQRLERKVEENARNSREKHDQHLARESELRDKLDKTGMELNGHIQRLTLTIKQQSEHATTIQRSHEMALEKRDDRIKSLENQLIKQKKSRNYD